MIRIVLIIFAGLFSLTRLNAQEDPILFSVNNIDVPVSEFRYIYDKTNADKADYSQASLEEYMNLYVKFKLKVQKALDMGLDTIPALQRELEGYRRQLANSYLIDKEVTEKLVREAYERSLEDINVSHIMISCPADAIPEDTTLALIKINKINNRIKSGESFETIAALNSEDKSSRKGKGQIGYLTALLPRGFYNFETLIYTTPVGEVAGPVRTSIGYHIIKINERRPAFGEMEIAHILTRKGPNLRSKARIDSIYSMLQKQDFESVAKQMSDDRTTSQKGGYLGFFGINKYEKSFEEATFALTEDGTYTKPVETSIGWHIIKRISKKATPSYEQSKRRLQARVAKDPRYDLAKQALIAKIKSEAGLQENRDDLKTFVVGLDDTFLSYKWTAPEENAEKRLFKIGDDFLVTMGDFYTYCQRSVRQRAKRGTGVKVKNVAYDLYDAFLEDNFLKYEESKLPSKYPDFKNLMREYEEGILLFEATKIKVWDRASEDTVGLKVFFDSHRGDYSWDQRANVTIYTIQTQDDKLAKKIYKKARKKDPVYILSKFNTENLISTKPNLIEKGKNKSLDEIMWKKGSATPLEQDKDKGTFGFIKMESIMPPTQKEFNEAKGYIIADYQDYLERRWVEELKQVYKVTVNDDVFNSLVK